ncbi:hypothetical protein BYT27DRAFT_6821233 [Phlegmacium glaucopus]|nr:hypothetical protein BYT27DRAFT_6821233 [Phlegmacium glaucopus]
MKPISIFGQPTSTRNYDQRFTKGAYYLIPLLRQLENHVSSDTYKNFVTYFDRQFESFLPSGHWRSTIFERESEGMQMAHVESDEGSADSMPGLQSVSNTDSGSDISNTDSGSDISQWDSEEEAGGPGSTIYRVLELAPLSTFPAWDEINASLNIRLTGPNSLKGLCNEAHFARSHLTTTSSALVNGSTQAKAALFCLKQIQSKGITKDLHIAFVKLLPHSLLHATQLPELRTAIQSLQTQHLTVYQRLPLETQNAITDYLHGGSQKPRKKREKKHPPGTVTDSSTQATSNQKPSTISNSSTAHQKVQKSSPTPQPPSSPGSKYTTSSQTQPTSQVPSHSTRAQPSPNASQKASTASEAPQNTRGAPQPPSSAGLKSSTPPQPSQSQPAACISQPSARTQASLSIAGKPLTRLQTPEQPCNASQPATPDPESSTAQGPSVTPQSTLGPSHPSESSTSVQGPSKRPSRPRKSGKGRRK